MKIADDDQCSLPAAATTSALTQFEFQLLDQLVPDRHPTSAAIWPAPDPAPGENVIWRGLARLINIAIGYSLRGEDEEN